ncbi:hypothetical protein BMETH_3057201286821, partial [methanotrophic bacterial endosymbiont of Bathymodiolus sp.]
PIHDGSQKNELNGYDFFMLYAATIVLG